ncbi:MAG: DNA (cytosine-5-)-methyltransferase [Candidatus Magasanikbacteria bacterium]|nr:DNA (cytosine-5-)-methyltransferase [Candidatus Magasanikbacteria bacterium]
MKIIRVVELFAGVGGFRIGLKQADNEKVKYKTIWNSQWEPSTKTQHASEIYKKHFGEKGHSCEDIRNVVDNKFHTIPEHDLLVGGFPCQDYSVARTANQANGLIGKKGVLWWSIFDILKKSGEKAPSFLLLENVDRLLKSPTKQRGRDFAVMLSSLASLNYIVEWRIINAAEYGFPQRRRRVFILAYKKGTKLNKKARNINLEDWINKKSVMAKGFPIYKNNNLLTSFQINTNPAKVSEEFSKNSPKISPFYNSGIMIDNKIYTKKVHPKYNGKKVILKDVLIDEKHVPEEFFIDEKTFERWKYLKNSKTEKRCTKDGFEYSYSEGGMIFPDNLENASRTIVTGEGGSSPSRFKHVIKTKTGRLRRLTPIELERLNMFPDNHTEGVSNTKRAFIMGNALVIGVIKKLGQTLSDFI